MPKIGTRGHVAMPLALAVALLPAIANACSVCMGAADDNIVIGVNMAVFMLLGVTGTMLGSIAAFMLHLHRRAKRFNLTQPDETSKPGV